jgi:hypothetical protein
VDGTQFQNSSLYSTDKTLAPLNLMFVGLPVVLYLRLMRPERKAKDVHYFYGDYEWFYTSAPKYIYVARYLIKQRDNLILVDRVA